MNEKQKRVYGIAMVACPLTIVLGHALNNDTLFLFGIAAWVYSMFYATGRWV